ncbi:MAG: integrase arm-type DNA-binding domain-containing protein [Notoacmeibacter sp.]|nr:integrase arm-type DNA-binding domain-containing protein [Notoacmeibacter sp.]
MAIVNRLTARGVAGLNEPGRHADGANLYLNISKSGAKSWVFLFRFAGKQKEMGLGSAGPSGVSLADARDLAGEARRLLAQGIDPLAVRQTAKAEARAVEAAKITFGQYADDYVRLHEREWANDKHRAQWRATTSDRYIRDLRRRPLAEVCTEDVLDAIKPFWTDKRETANRIRQRIEAILDAAKVEGKRTGENPARWQGHLSLILPAHGKRSKGHHAAMPWKRMPAFVEALREKDGIAARAVEFTILTACRSGEIRNATWGEFDLADQVWTIPAARMKARREHRVPLSARVIEIVEAMAPLRPRDSWESALVFPGQRGRPMSDMTLSAVLRRMKVIDATVHGFRSSFRDWGAECTSAPHEVLEAALAHVVGDGTVAAYFRSDLFDRRRGLLEQWAAFIAAESDNRENVFAFRSPSGGR